MLGWQRRDVPLNSILPSKYASWNTCIGIFSLPLYNRFSSGSVIVIYSSMSLPGNTTFVLRRAPYTLLSVQYAIAVGRPQITNMNRYVLNPPYLTMGVNALTT